MVHVHVIINNVITILCQVYRKYCLKPIKYLLNLALNLLFLLYLNVI